MREDSNIGALIIDILYLYSGTPKIVLVIVKGFIIISEDPACGLEQGSYKGSRRFFVTIPCSEGFWSSAPGLPRFLTRVSELYEHMNLRPQTPKTRP